MDLLVENTGRINYGTQIGDRKGINGIRFGQRKHFGWDMYPLEMKDLASITYKACDSGSGTTTFFRGTLEIEGDSHDTFIKLDGFHHGFVMVNGFNLGRYYNDAGPQKTLYCPAPILKSGSNEIIVFETDSCESNIIEFVAEPIWN